MRDCFKAISANNGDKIETWTPRASKIVFQRNSKRKNVETSDERCEASMDLKKESFLKPFFVHDITLWIIQILSSLHFFQWIHQKEYPFFFPLIRTQGILDDAKSASTESMIRIEVKLKDKKGNVLSVAFGLLSLHLFVLGTLNDSKKCKKRWLDAFAWINH